MRKLKSKKNYMDNNSNLFLSRRSPPHRWPPRVLASIGLTLCCPAITMADNGREIDQGVAQKQGETIEEVSVQGIREVVRSSIDTKMRSSTIVDAVSTDDIGNLPAMSLSEVLETVTGAAGHRGKGGGSEMAIRGLGPFLGATTFNGRQASNGSGDRSVNFSQFPSELANSIKIYKSQQADMVEGGIAGVVDIGSVRPLDYGKRRVQADTKLSYSPYAESMENGDAAGWRGTASYLDQFQLGSMGELGFSIGIQQNEVTNPQDRAYSSSTWSACDATATVSRDSRGRYNRCTDTVITPGSANSENPYYLVPNSFGLRQQGEEDERSALFTAFQWQPNDVLEVNLDAQYSKRNFTEDRHDLVFADARRIGPDAVYDENGTLLAFAGTSQLSSEGQYFERLEEYRGVGINTAWFVNDQLTLSADLSYSHTLRNDVNRRSRLRTDALDIYGNSLAEFTEEYAGFDGSVPYTWDIRGGDVAAIAVDPRFDLNDHSLFSDDALLLRDNTRLDHTIEAFRFDGAYALEHAFIREVKSGVRLAEMRYQDYFLRNEFSQDDRALDMAVNEACRIKFPQGNFMENVSGAAINSWATFDTLCLYEQYTGTQDTGLPDERRSNSSRDVVERTYAAYAMADFAVRLGLPLSGNFGVRYVRTEITSTGLRSGLTAEPLGDSGNIQLIANGDFEEVRYKNDTWDLLPSVNATLELDSDLLLRGALYRALARPDPSSLGAGRDFQLENDDAGFSSIAEAIGGVTANGSPNLLPLRSWNADLSLEWYPNDDTLLSGALYLKRFQGGRVPIAIDETFVIDGESVTIPVTQTITTEDESTLSGFELSAAHSFDYLPTPLNGLGVKLGYNYADTDYHSHDIVLGDVIDPVTGEIVEGMVDPAAISGYSRHSGSFQLFYEIGAVDVQAIYKYRSDYYQDFVGGNSQLRYVEPSQVVDLRASYRITRNIQLRLQGVNLTDEPRVDHMPIYGSQRDYQAYGPTYYLGVQVRF
ncbi:TonB-dependent receptor [Microbulbifer harenosus]|uniref:TonB-dependent receptor n=1 Tax=Microbulbifer harenosus TaxID=2576840 RepID=A0ABY2UF32_9GAMM|nr:TonB-dependent receptor [Microbulbifer harenosus]